MSNTLTHPPPRFDAATLEAMRHRLPEYLAARGVELTRRGARLVARCPMHDDSSPSFAVYGSKLENCGCHPCDFSGDVFAVSEWMGRAGCFTEAVRDVAAALGVYLPQEGAQAATGQAMPPQRAAKEPEPPFTLPDADRAKVDAARLAWCDAFHSGNPIVDRIAESLGIDRETLRLASWGASGLGLANEWLCYVYPAGLKWRNPDPQGKPRFVWIVGRALAPWRFEWVKPETQTIYLTEGESDTLALIAAGAEADGKAACVASPGTSFPQAWALLFTGKRVVLCFDTDPPGMTAAAKIAGMLAGHAASVSIWKGGHK